jgi:hypothetical protein
LLSFWKGELHACEVTKILEIKSFGGQGLIWQLWNYFPFNFGNSIFTHMKVELRAFYGN